MGGTVALSGITSTISWSRRRGRPPDLPLDDLALGDALAMSGNGKLEESAHVWISRDGWRRSYG
jgi:hypothetical protein